MLRAPVSMIYFKTAKYNNYGATNVVYVTMLYIIVLGVIHN